MFNHNDGKKTQSQRKIELGIIEQLHIKTKDRIRSATRILLREGPENEKKL